MPIRRNLFWSCPARESIFEYMTDARVSCLTILIISAMAASYDFRQAAHANPFQVNARLGEVPFRKRKELTLRSAGFDFYDGPTHSCEEPASDQLSLGSSCFSSYLFDSILFVNSCDSFEWLIPFEIHLKYHSRTCLDTITRFSPLILCYCAAAFVSVILVSLLVWSNYTCICVIRAILTTTKE